MAPDRRARRGRKLWSLYLPRVLVHIDAGADGDGDERVPIVYTVEWKEVRPHPRRQW